MTVVVSLLNGLEKVLRNWQVVILLVVVQLTAAVLMSSPLAVLVHQQWDHSLVGEHAGLQDADPGFERTVWEENLVSRIFLLRGIYGGFQLWVAALVYIAISLLILAGVLPLYTGLDLKFSWERFWTNASRYFRSFLGLALIAALLFWAADFASVTLDAFIADAVAGSDDEPMVFLTSVVITGGFRFIVFGLIVLVFQYAKAIAASEGLRNIFYLTRKAFTFVSRYFFGAALLFVILSLLELGINALDVAVWYYVLPGSEFWVHMTWLAAVTVLLVIIKLAFLAGAMKFFDETQRRTDDRWRVQLDSGSYGAAY